MKAVEIFDVCHGRYRGLREWLDDSAGAVRSLDMEKPSEGYHWRPGRARACEYVADFERIGRHALRRAEWKGRLKLFNIYFVHSVEYRRAISLVGVAEGTFDYWYREVKRAMGAEFSRTNLYPPTRYFADVRPTAVGIVHQFLRRDRDGEACSIGRRLEQDPGDKRGHEDRFDLPEQPDAA
jgi:hypothetical protein